MVVLFVVSGEILMVDGNAGKGDTYRHQSRQEKREFDRGYLRCFGIKCPRCMGLVMLTPCSICDNLGYIPKPKKPSL